MKQVEFDLVGVSELTFGKAIFQKKSAEEMHDAFEERTWRQRLHADKDGNVYIPAEALKACLDVTAKFLSESVPGKGKATYTKHFQAGIIVLEPLYLGLKVKDVRGVPKHVSSTGKPGGPRVWRTFPVVDAGWKAHGKIMLLDPVLIAHPEKVEEYLKSAGRFIGLLAFRVRNGGYCGRFEVKNFKVGKEEKAV